MIAYALASGLQVLSILFSLLAMFVGFGGYWYLRQLKKDWAVDEATTNRFDLPERGKLSGLYVHLVATNDEQLDDVANPWPFQNTDIRIIGNGNVEIIDLRGRQLQAMNFWDTGKMPKDNLQEHDAAYVEQWAFIPFGRYMGDPKYGLDLERFVAGVQFEETNVFSTTRYQDASEKYTIHALMRKNPEAGLFAGGFFKKRQVLNKDTATETQYAVKLPTVNKLKQIHVFSEPDLDADNIPDVNVYTNVNAIFLSIKSREEYILDNINAREWATIIHQMYEREARTQIVAYGHGAGTTSDPMIYEANGRSCLAVHDSVAIYREDNATSWLERTADIYSYTAAGSGVASRFYLNTHGISYHGDIPLLMIDPMAEEEEYMDAYENRDVYVEITEGGNEGNWYLVLDELQKTYPS